LVAAAEAEAVSLLDSQLTFQGEIIMSETSTPVQDSEKPSLPAYPETDWFLQKLVSFANEWGLEISITLQVSGMLVSGVLVGGTKYFDEFAELFSDGLKNYPDLGQAFHELISSYKKLYEVKPEENPDLPPPHYIHLRNAKFYHPGQQPIPISDGVVWRGRISEVGGFNLGSLGPAEG
jgi:hypothetical protein